MGERSGYGTIISHISGETRYSFIADFSVAWSVGKIKTGVPCCLDRTYKYN
ncbi:hypothetical protein [Candidatus Ichthyocystis sparus]|uniref:hypothetical protein n=1 Tax=Candidatus Ichthyocystis sparus TaxID=1561004 RepID=UPI00159ECAB2